MQTCHTLRETPLNNHSPHHHPPFTTKQSQTFSPKPNLSMASNSPSMMPAGKKPQPIHWTEQETLNLIQSYRDTWYSIKRGSLKAGQWEEVSVTIAARCGYDYSHPAKSAIQCRHKMEKLRQRYRNERQQLSHGSSPPWPYFHLMESLQHGGTLPISARPLAFVPSVTKTQEEVDEEEEEDFSRGKSRSINHILRRHQVEPKRSRKEREEVEAGERGRSMGMKLAMGIKGLAERFIAMEKRKMEMMRETERYRMEMETKRIQMITSSNRKMVDAIARAFETVEEDDR